MIGPADGKINCSDADVASGRENGSVGVEAVETKYAEDGGKITTTAPAEERLSTDQQQRYQDKVQLKLLMKEKEELKKMLTTPPGSGSAKIIAPIAQSTREQHHVSVNASLGDDHGESKTTAAPVEQQPTVDQRQYQERLQRLRKRKEELERANATKEETLAKLVTQLKGQLHQNQQKQQQGIGSSSFYSQTSATLGESAYPPGQSEGNPYIAASDANATVGINARRNNNLMKRRLPRNTRAETDSTMDIMESQSSNGRHNAKKLARGKRYAIGSVMNRNHVTSTRDLLLKIVKSVLLNSDDESLGEDNAETQVLLMTLIVEAMIGILLAFAAVTFTLFVYHHFVPHMTTSHSAKAAAFHLTSDNETLANFEESSGLKFIDMELYLSMKRELDEARNKTREGTAKIEERTAQIAKLRADLQRHGDYEAEIPKMKSRLKLDWFCGHCEWSASEKVSCQRRVDLLIETYHTPKYEAMLKAMERESCWYSKDIKRVLDNWDGSAKEDWCDDCGWGPDPSARCLDRVEYVHNNYKVPFLPTLAKTMVESPSCTHSFHAAEVRSALEDWDERMMDFCDKCEWTYEPSVNCLAHAKMVHKDTHGAMFRETQAKVMVESPKCTKSFEEEARRREEERMRKRAEKRKAKKKKG